MPRTRVLLADDHAVVAQGLEALLKESFELVGVVHDGRALIDAAERLRPDVIVTDISMPLLNGLDAIRQIRARRPDTKLIVLTMHQETQLAVDAFRAGAVGYLLKVSPGEELITAIGQVAQGRSYVSTLLAKDLITLLIEAAKQGSSGDTPLTPRQREVLQLIAEGHTMKEIASILYISPRTAESHKYEIMQTLDHSFGDHIPRFLAIQNSRPCRRREPLFLYGPETRLCPLEACEGRFVSPYPPLSPQAQYAVTSIRPLAARV